MNPGQAIPNARRDGWRLPAHEIEHAVADAVSALLGDQSALVDAVRSNGLAADDVSNLVDSVARWNGDTLDLVQRVDLDRNEITIYLALKAFTDNEHSRIRHVVPMRLRRRGVERRMVLNGPDKTVASGKVDPALTKVVARAHIWFDALAAGRAETLGEIADAEGCHKRYVGRLLPLAFLAPDITEAILAGRQPVDLTAEKLTRHTDLPLSWDHQKALLGFN